MPEEIQNQNNHQSLITEIQNRIQFLVMIAIFFPAVVYYFFNIYDKSNADKIALSYAWLVAAYLLTYIFFEILKNKIKIIFFTNNAAKSYWDTVICIIIYYADSC